MVLLEADHKRVTSLLRKGEGLGWDKFDKDSRAC